MATGAEKHLMQLKGVGAATARRLVAAGLDDFAKLAASGEEALRAIRGLNPRSIPLILAQAAEQAGAAESATEPAAARSAKLQQSLQRLQSEAQQLVATLPATGQPVKKKRLAALHKEAARLGALLERIDPHRPPRPRRLGKALDKAGRKLGKLAGGGAKKTTKGLKKARKRLQKVLR